MSHYLSRQPIVARHYSHLGATPTTLSPASFSVEDIANRVAQRVENKVTTEVSRIVENGVERMTTAAGVGLDRFLDSPAGVALLDKVESKFDRVIVNTVKKHQIELALLGIAAASVVMGGVAVGSKMTPTLTKASFLVAGLSLAIVASGVVSPEDPLPVPSRRLPSRG